MHNEEARRILPVAEILRNFTERTSENRLLETSQKGNLGRWSGTPACMRKPFPAEGQRGCGCRLGEAVTSARVHRSPAPVGGGARVRLAILQPSDKQGLRAAVCDERSVHLCSDDSPFGEAIGPYLGPFGQSI